MKSPHYLLWLVLPWLAACAIEPVHPQMAAGLNGTVPSTFELEGRLAVRTARDGGQVHLHWQHAADVDTITLSSPLGETEGVLTSRSDGAVWLDDAGRAHPAANAEILSQQWLGWILPLKELRYWIAGAADPTQVSDTRREDGRLVLRQSGWTVEFLRWQDRDGRDLPDRLNFSGQGVSARLVVSNWQTVR